MFGKISEKCPKCGSSDLCYSSSPWRDMLRRLRGSRRRYCRSCEERWVGVDKTVFPVSFKMTVLIVLGVTAALMIALMATTSFNPVDWVKSQVVNQYDKTYGGDSRKKLWQDWGKLYHARSGAEADYGSH